MELKELYERLEKMSEQISKLRESAARTEASLESLAHMHTQVSEITQTQSQWKGGMLVVSAIFSVVAAVVARYLIK